MKEIHIHRFNKPKTKKVLVRKGNKHTSAYDILKQRQCACGKVETYDLERVTV